MGVRSDFWVALFGAAMGVATLVLLPSEVDPEGLRAISNTYSAAFFPILIGALLIVCGLLLALDNLLWPAPAAQAERQSIEAPLSLAATAGCILAYAMLVYWIGMVPASMLGIVALGLVLGNRRPLVLIPVAIAVPLAIYLIFERFLHVLLPAGRLFS